MIYSQLAFLAVRGRRRGRSERGPLCQDVIDELVMVAKCYNRSPAAADDGTDLSCVSGVRAKRSLECRQFAARSSESTRNRSDAKIMKARMLPIVAILNDFFEAILWSIHYRVPFHNSNEIV